MAFDILDSVFEEKRCLGANSKQLFNILGHFCTYGCTHVHIFLLSGSWGPDTRQFQYKNFIAARTK